MDQYIEVFTSIDEISDEFLLKWRELESNSLSPNLYLSPDFIIPSLLNLSPNINFIIIGIYDLSTGNTLIGLSVFEIVKPSIKYPFTYLTTYQSCHSFLGGVLLHKIYYEEYITTLFSYIHTETKYNVVEFRDFYLDEKYLNIINEAINTFSFNWHECYQVERLILYPEKCTSDYIDNTINKKLYKNLKRKQRSLKKIGNLEFRTVASCDIDKVNIENFLCLESSGWKGVNKTALNSSHESRLFFYHLIEGFRDNNSVFFTEMYLDDKCIATTCNFSIHNVGFAFKSAYDEEFKKYSPGMLNEVYIIENAQSILHGIKYVDSGTMPGSYLAKLWKDTYFLKSGMFTLNKRTNLYLILYKYIKILMTSLFRYVRKT